jgi:hypothetical protein
MKPFEWEAKHTVEQSNDSRKFQSLLICTALEKSNIWLLASTLAVQFIKNWHMAQ